MMRSAANEPCAAPFSVIIPACNEEAVIDRCLGALLSSSPDHARPEVIVVCNGCTDSTAARARCWPRVRVIELETGSKPAALNAGNRAARATPRFFVDADVAVSFGALAATTAVLREPGVKAAAPQRTFDFEGCAWPVRRYFAVWQTLPFAEEGMGGCGVYGLSEQGLAEIGEFPDIISDDGYVRARFAVAERRSVGRDDGGAPAVVTIYPPRTVGDLIRVEARRRQGDAELRTLFPALQSAWGRTSRLLLASLFTRHSPLDLAIYAGIKLAGRARHRLARAQGSAGRWLRDESSRLGVAR